MIDPGTVVAFRPLTVDRMTLPTVHQRCLDTGRVDIGDQLGALKLWPGERLHVSRVISAEAMLCKFHSHLLLVLMADTEPALL